MTTPAGSPSNRAPWQRQSFRPWKAVACVVALLALLDVTTSAVPSFIDVFGRPPALPFWIRGVEAVLGLGLLVALVPAVRPALAWLYGLPGSTLGKSLMLVYLAGCVTVVLFRTEAYPLSNVGMFSAVPPRPVDMTVPRRTSAVVFVRDRSGGVQPISALREGSPLVARYTSDWDYKLGWVMYLFGTSDSRALQEASEVARRAGFDRAVRATVTYDPMTGKDLRVEPFARPQLGPPP